MVACSTAAAAVTVLLPATGAAAAPAAAVTPAVTMTAPVQPATVVAPAIGPSPAVIRASAVASALSKVGAPYRWGAAGPNAFDCSGLVTWAFKQVGVSLPRTSRAMSRVGTPVAKADLQPGDLVFFYRPVSHVAIYIGAGKVVHASNRKSPVKISDLNRMPFNTARRI